jgi:hypothetical protein
MNQPVFLIPRARWLAVVTVLLLLVVASRVIRIGGLDPDAHEIWAIWQSQGSASEIIAWTPYDWGALSFLVLGGWQGLVGSDPMLLRALSILAFTLGCACVYELMRTLLKQSPLREQAAVLALLAYAAPVGLILFSLFTRGYALLILLLPLALLLVLRWIARPRWITGIGLVISLALMVYIHPTGLLGAAAVVVYITLSEGMRARRGLPLLLAFALLIAPEIAAKFGTGAARLGNNPVSVQPERLNALLEFYAGPLALVWMGLLAAASVGMIVARRPAPRMWLLLLWAVTGVIGLLTVGSIIGLDAARHAWWSVFPLTLWLAWGLAYLPRAGQRAAAVVLLGLMFAPLTLNRFDDSAFPNPPLDANFAWLSDHAAWGDALVVDPTSACAPFPEEWDYQAARYFPHGLAITDNPSGFQRVWYATSNGWTDSETEARVKTGRLPGIFVGEPTCVFQLFSGAPNPEGVRFENGLRFHGLEVLETQGVFARPRTDRLVLHEGDSIPLRLWWSADGILDADYSVAIHLYDVETGELLAQHDGTPTPISLQPEVGTGAGAMSTWTPETLVVEERMLQLPWNVPRTRNGIRQLELRLIVYQWWDNERVAAYGADAESRLPVRQMWLRSW